MKNTKEQCKVIELQAFMPLDNRHGDSSSNRSTSGTVSTAVIAVIAVLVLVIMAMGVFIYGKMVPESIIGRRLRSEQRSAVRPVRALIVVGAESSVARRCLFNSTTL
eukprot:m.713900 g.713900  ORF g.713900 m.713900 type:complete len:107 (-) comp22971_c1_seq60:2847-3167(-)